MDRFDHLINGIYARRFTAAAPSHALLVCHGLGGHGGIYDSFCERYATARRGDVWSIDLPGFGRSPSAGGRGSFTAEQWVEATCAVASHIRRTTGLPVVTKGSSLGVFAASGALIASDDVSAAVCMGYAFAGVGRLMDGGASPWATDAGRAILRQLGRNAVLKLDRFIDFDVDYGYSGATAEKRLDPLNTWEIDLASWASIYTYEAPAALETNTKPVLFAVGEHDPLAPPSTVKAIADLIPGPVEFHVHPGGSHQLKIGRAHV